MADRPHRLPGISYIGFHRYSLTFCVYRRDKLFTKSFIVDDMLEQISHAASAREFAILAYCFMPDHLHVMSEAQSPSSDLVAFAHQVKQRTSFGYQQRHGQGRLWRQKGYFEHVVRDEVSTQTHAKYILENPVRAGLTQGPLDYPFSGSLVFSREQLTDLWHEGTP